jgi:hypothetical protein
MLRQLIAYNLGKVTLPSLFALMITHLFSGCKHSDLFESASGRHLCGRTAIGNFY